MAHDKIYFKITYECLIIQTRKQILHNTNERIHLSLKIHVLEAQQKEKKKTVSYEFDMKLSKKKNNHDSKNIFIQRRSLFKM